MPNPIQWIASWAGAIRFLVAASKKDRSGKASGFLYAPDDPSVADFYSTEQVFDRRIFISFERGSLPLAERFEAALRRVGLMPWRYEPSATESVSESEYALELADMKNKYRDTVARLMATVRRCPAVLIIVSDSSHKSPYCQMEAFTTAVIHSFWPKSRVRNEAGVYSVFEHTGIAPLPMLDRFWSRVYEEGLEDGLAALIAGEIDRLAEILRIVEARRAKINR
jgi:hypothetical protein